MDDGARTHLADYIDHPEQTGFSMDALVSIIGSYIKQYDDNRHGPVTALEALTAVRLLAESMTESRGWITGEARREGNSWVEIGQALGMTRQSAWEWFKKYAEQATPGFEHMAVSELAALGEKPVDQ
ncbi:hypothetical protein ABZY44_24015 [Streptomyces sp. NPDC006544]|uniref:hypothetical protein n=1 Tax=Streptomyces sp. NPDC006544 TaxID=3154583 RepID=UPI0033B4D1EC